MYYLLLSNCAHLLHCCSTHLIPLMFLYRFCSTQEVAIMKNILCELTETYWHLPYIKCFKFLRYKLYQKESIPFVCNMLHRLNMNKLSHGLVKVIVKSGISTHSNDWGLDALWKFVGLKTWLKERSSTSFI